MSKLVTDKNAKEMRDIVLKMIAEKASRKTTILRKANLQLALEDNDKHAERKEDRLIKAHDDEYFSTFESQDFCDRDRQ